MEDDSQADEKDRPQTIRTVRMTTPILHYCWRSIVSWWSGTGPLNDRLETSGRTGRNTRPWLKNDHEGSLAVGASTTRHSCAPRAAGSPLRLTSATLPPRRKKRANIRE